MTAKTARCVAAPLLLALLALSTPASAETRAFTGAKLMPVTGPVIDNGTLVIEDGKIAAIGDVADVAIPRGAEVIDVSGKVIIPGLVDTHSHIGEVAGGDSSGPIQPETRVLDSINVRDAGFDRSRAGGVTTANLMPGSGHLISGQTLYVKLREGNTIESLAYRRADGTIDGGLKMANGTNSRKDTPFPGTRAKSASLVRAKYIAAQEYRDKIAAAGNDASKLPDRDLALEALVEVIAGTRIVHFHTHRHDDVMTVLRLKAEFGFDVVLHHVSEAKKVAAEIAAANVPVSAILVDAPGGKLEATDLLSENAAALEQAGVLTALHTDDYITDSRLFLRMAAMAVRAGMTEQGALESLTIAGAKMLRMEDRIGSLEAGKDADFVILSGHPFSVYTDVEETWIEGEKLFDLDDPDHRAIAEGGYGVLAPSHAAHTHHGFHEGH